MPYCSNCGAKLPDSASFCSECGAKVVRASLEGAAPAGNTASRPDPSATSRKPTDGFSFDPGHPQANAQDGFRFQPEEPSEPASDGETFSFHSNASSRQGPDFGDFPQAFSKPYQSFLDDEDDFSFQPPRSSSSSQGFSSFDEADDFSGFQKPYVSYDADGIGGTSNRSRSSSSGSARRSTPPKASQARGKGTSKKGGKKTGGWIALLCIILVAAVGLGIFFWTRSNVDTSELYTQAILLMDQGEYEGASELLLDILDAEPDNVDAMLRLADCYVNMGDSTRAAELLQAGYEQTQDERLQTALAELDTTGEADATTPAETTTTPPPETTTTPPPVSEPPFDLSDAFLGNYDDYSEQFGQLYNQENTSDTYTDADGNEVELQSAPYTYNGLIVSTQNGRITNMTVYFDQDVNYTVLGIGKEATYNETLNALGAPETAAAENEYDTLVYLPENGEAVKYYFLDDELSFATIFLGYSQNG